MHERFKYLYELIYFMSLPTYEWAIQMYYTYPAVLSVTLIASISLIALFYALGLYSGRKDTLIYMWEVGEKHSQIEHRTLYNKWKNGIRD